MIVIFSLIYFLLMMLLMITLINALLGPRLRSGPVEKSDVTVSVLIPARNEANNIDKCLKSIQQQDYEQLEIIVLDDNSNDDTFSLAQSIAQNDPRIKIISGSPLPSGWTGKNWACHQLSEQAGGDIIIFTDADNRYAPEAVGKTVSRMLRYNLDMLSAFPQQMTTTFFEKLIVPVVDLFLYSFLPLWLTYILPHPSLAAANGQWIAFRRSTYEKIGGHAAVANQIVEDVELSRLAKRKDCKIMTSSGTGIVFGYMYSSFKEVWEGFTKNLFGLSGHNSIIFIMFQVMMLTIFIGPVVLILFPDYFFLSLFAIILAVLIRLILVAAFRHPPLVSILLHPVSILITMLIGFNSFIKFNRGRIHWKLREIKTK